MDFDAVNTLIKEETKKCTQQLKRTIKSLGIKHISSKENSDPLTGITNKFPIDGLMIKRIRFIFKLSGVFVHKGVGRGTTASQVGSTNRKAKEWFNPVIENFADDLAEKIADTDVDIVFNKLKIK